VPVIAELTTVVEPLECWRGRAYPLGASYDGSGTNFAVFSEVASQPVWTAFHCDAQNGESFGWPDSVLSSVPVDSRCLVRRGR
jgi:hypothetical protein